jgi:hypothetical protein
MPSPTYRRIQTQNRDVNLVQDSVVALGNSIGTGPFVGGTILSNQSVGTSVTSIAHTLGYTPTVLFVGPPNVQANVWNPQASDTKFVYLQSSAPCTLQIWVK